MEITGCDSVVFTFSPPREVFARALASILARWPSALVDFIDESPSELIPASGLPPERLPTGAGFLLFHRDAAMARHMHEAAYTPMPDGDGPFAVITREPRDVVFEVAELNELRAADHTPGGGRPPDPYRAWLCTPSVVEVTAVTPGDPDAHPFSSWVLAEVRRACSG